MSSPRILAFAGSLRTDSWNKKLVRVAARGSEAAGAEVTVIDLRDYPLPVYDGDIEATEGLPGSAVLLKEQFKSHDGLLIACPEYNGSVSAALKNTIDWVSRPAEGEKPMVRFTGKVAALMATSPGALGGLRGLVHIRAILSGIRVMVIPEQRAIGKAFEAFDDAGNLKDEAERAAVEALGARVAEVAARLAG